MEKAERDAELREELEALRKESKVNKFAKSFLAMGYSEEQATKAAEAQYSGDTDELFRIQKQYQEEYAKKIRADIMKTMPAPATGNDDDVQITQEQFDNMSYLELKELYEKRPAVYKKFAK
jgi:SUMO ligase MMS21 Smc5/6 complex component